MYPPVIIPNVKPSLLAEPLVKQQFKLLLKQGFKLQLHGQAKKKADGYLPRTRPPKHLIHLFGAQYFLSDIRREEGFRFFIAYIVMPQHGMHRKRIYPRIFYKDSSLIWRSASHLVKTNNEHWVGKGDLKPVIEEGKIAYYSAEETTNLPYEIDAALDTISRRTSDVLVDKIAQELVLRNGPEDRVAPYADFSNPRRKAMRNPDFSINENKKIAWFDDLTKPRSLHFAKGYTPDFKHGLIDQSESRSKMYGGNIKKYRIASLNREVQYLFISGPKQTWIIPPQPLDNLITSYGVRAVDADVDEALCLPGFEFHYLEVEDDPSSLYSQIPTGFAGAPSEHDPDRSDTSPWLKKMPIMQKFLIAKNNNSLGSIVI